MLIKKSISTLILSVCSCLWSCANNASDISDPNQILKRSDVSSIRVLDGNGVGYAAKQGKCYLLAKELVSEYSLEQLKILLESENSYVRCLGMICLANDIEKYQDFILNHGTEEVVTYISGCIVDKVTVKQFAENLVKDERFRWNYIGNL